MDEQGPKSPDQTGASGPEQESLPRHAQGQSPRSGTPPPLNSRWKKGQSGNPRGRPRGTGLTDSLKRLVRGTHNGKPIADLLAESMLKHALTGKYQHLKEIFDRLEGRPTESLNAKVGMTHTVFHVPPPRVIGETQGQYKARVDLESLAANYRQRLEGGEPEGGG